MSRGSELGNAYLLLSLYLSLSLSLSLSPPLSLHHWTLRLSAGLQLWVGPCFSLVCAARHFLLWAIDLHMVDICLSLLLVSFK